MLDHCNYVGGSGRGVVGTGAPGSEQESTKDWSSAAMRPIPGRTIVAGLEKFCDG
jgi:hypothetical protein